MLSCPRSSLVYLPPRPPGQSRSCAPEASESHPAIPVPSSGARCGDCTYRDLVSSNDSCQAPRTILDGEMTPYLRVCAGLRRVEHRVCLWEARTLLESSTPVPEGQSGSPPLPTLGGRRGFLDRHPWPFTGELLRSLATGVS